MRPMIAVVSVLSAVIAVAQEHKPAFEMKGHDRPVLSLAFSPDGKRLATAADDEKLIIWDVEKKAEIATLKGHTTNENHVSWTPDGKRVVAIGNDSNIRVWDVDAKKEVRSIAVGDISGGARDAALSPDGKTIAIVGRGTLRLHDLESGKQTASYVVHEQYGVNAVAWSPDGKTIATGGTDRKLNLLSAADGKVTKTLDTDGRGVCLAFSPDGAKVYLATDSQHLQGFDVASGEAVTLVDKSLPTLDVQPSRDGKLLVVGGTARGPMVIDLATSKVREPKMDSDDWIKAVAISPNGKLVAGGANGGAISVWALE